MEAERKHPLEDEEIYVTLTLVYPSVEAVAVERGIARADAEPDVSDVVEDCKRRAMDALLEQLEQQGG